MRAYDSLRRPGEFTRLYRRGHRTHRGHLVVYHLQRKPGVMLRVGIAIGKPVGGAVQRNLIRRRFQGILDQCDTAQGSDLDMLIVAKPGAAALSFAELEQELRSALPGQLLGRNARPAIR